MLCITDYICEGVDLTGVEIVEQDRRFIKQARKEVESQAQKMLELGMETQVCAGLNPLPNDKILDWSKLETFADDKVNVTEKLKLILGRVEREKMLVTSIFSFSHNVFKRLLIQGL